MIITITGYTLEMVATSLFSQTILLFVFHVSVHVSFLLAALFVVRQFCFDGQSIMQETFQLKNF